MIVNKATKLVRTPSMKVYNNNNNKKNIIERKRD